MLGRNISALDPPTTLFCTFLFVDSFKGLEPVITGLMDNKGNSQALAKLVMTKLPLPAVSTGLAAWIPGIPGGKGRSPPGSPRLQNEERTP